METTYDAPEDDPITGAVLEICEVEVYGMFIKFLKQFHVYYFIARSPLVSSPERGGAFLNLNNQGCFHSILTNFSFVDIEKNIC